MDISHCAETVIKYLGSLMQKDIKMCLAPSLQYRLVSAPRIDFWCAQPCNELQELFMVTEYDIRCIYAIQRICATRVLTFFVQIGVVSLMHDLEY